MKRVAMFLVLLLAFPLMSYAHQIPEGAAPFKKSSTCKSCHPEIYKEWQSSMHSKSSLFKDKAHGAIHKAYSSARNEANKPVNYFCGSCHTPMADKLAEFIEGKSLPTGEDWKEHEGVGCTFCHRIDSIVHAERFNSYSLNKDGALSVSNPSGNAKHKTVKNPIFGNGALCMGCHSHLISPGGTPMCVARDEGEVGNCLACHMEKVSGKPAITSKMKKEHRSHVMGGGHDIDMLKKAVIVEASVKTEKKYTSNKPSVYEEIKILKVDINNVITHSFPSTSPMRMAFLKITAKDSSGKIIWENFKNSPMEDKKRSLFMKVFTDGKNPGVPPWKAKGVAMDSRIKNGEKRTINYELPNGDIKKISVVLIYRLFPPKAINKMGVPRDGVNEKNHILKKVEIAL